jgi:hypothetical protein
VSRRSLRSRPFEPVQPALGVGEYGLGVGKHDLDVGELADQLQIRPTRSSVLLMIVFVPRAGLCSSSSEPDHPTDHAIAAILSARQHICGIKPAQRPSKRGLRRFR